MKASLTIEVSNSTADVTVDGALKQSCLQPTDMYKQL